MAVTLPQPGEEYAPEVRHATHGSWNWKFPSQGLPCCLSLWGLARTLAFYGSQFPYLHSEGWGQWLRCGPPPPCRPAVQEAETQNLKRLRGATQGRGLLGNECCS